MSSSAEREQERRAAVEAAYIRPDPVVPRHPSTDAERPKTAVAIKAALLAAGFEVEEWSATVYDGVPSWKRRSPEDALLSYFSTPVVVYHLAGVRTIDENPGIVAVDVQQVSGVWARSRMGVLDALGRGDWIKVPVTSVAKRVREEA
jgi:hypothetical protein